MKNLTKTVVAVLTLAAAGAALANGSTAPPVQVPEPGSLALLAAGVAGAIAALRGRRK